MSSSMIKKSYYLAGIIYLIVIISIVTSANAYNVTLNYNEYIDVSVDAGPGDEVNWDFSGSNIYVGIYVVAMTSADYNQFLYGGTYYYYTLSDGSHYSDQGTFNPTTRDTWYIVFVNVDPDQMSTSLTYDVTVYNPLVTLIVIIVVVGIVIVCIIGVAVGASNKAKKRKEMMLRSIAPPPVAAQQPLPPETIQPAQPTQPVYRYCQDCGAPIDPNAIYCESCGKKLK